MKVAVLLVATVACDGPAAAPDAAPPWTAPTTLPRLSLESGVTALGTRLVVLGGFDTSLQQGLHIATTVNTYDTLADTWATLPDVPVAWTHPQLAAAGGALYLLGGLDGTDFVARGDAFVLPAGGAAWTPIASMPPGLERGSAAVVVSPPHVFLLGGASTTAALATCLDYNLMTDTWTELPPLPSPRSHAAAIRRQDGSLIVAGGLATLDASQPLAETWILPLGGAAWLPRMAMPTARGGCASGNLGGRLVCAGGEAGVGALSVVEAYDANQDLWLTQPELPSPRAGTQGAAIGQKLFVPGGARTLAFEPTDTLFVLSTASATP